MKKIYLWAAIVVIAVVVVLVLWGGKKPVTQTQKETLTIKGSDTEVQLVSNLAEAFSQKYPDIDIAVTGGGSGVGIASLLNKEIDIANSSRAMKGEELVLAKEKNIDVQEFILAIDGLSIIVHPSNNVEKLSLDQISKIYKGEIKNWREVGGKNAKIVLYGRQSTSGTYVFFRDAVVKDDYSDQMKNMEGSQAIVDAVTSDENSIGYVGVGYVKGAGGKERSDIKILPVMVMEGSSAISPLDKEAVNKGEYPIARQIFQYLSQVPAKDSAMEKLIKFEASSEGQAIIEESGFYPLTKQDIQQNQLLFEKIK